MIGVVVGDQKHATVAAEENLIGHGGPGDKYSSAMQFLHWSLGGGTLAAIGTVLVSDSLCARAHDSCAPLHGVHQLFTVRKHHVSIDVCCGDLSPTAPDSAVLLLFLWFNGVVAASYKIGVFHT